MREFNLPPAKVVDKHKAQEGWLARRAFGGVKVCDRAEDKERHQQQGQAQAHEAILEEACRPFPLVGARHEVARQQEEQSHEEGGIDTEEGSKQRRAFRLEDGPAAAGWTIRLASVVCHDKDRKENTKIIGKYEAVAGPRPDCRFRALMLQHAAIELKDLHVALLGEHG
jgi:hypothetical protein